MSSKENYDSFQLDDLISSDESDGEIHARRTVGRYKRQSDGAAQPFIRSACPSPSPSAERSSHDSNAEAKDVEAIRPGSPEAKAQDDTASQITLAPSSPAEDSFSIPDVEQPERPSSRWPSKKEVFETYLVGTIIIYAITLYVLFMLWYYSKLPSHPLISLLIMHCIYSIPSDILVFGILESNEDEDEDEDEDEGGCKATWTWAGLTLLELLLVPLVVRP